MRTLLTGIGALYTCPEGLQEDAGLVTDAAICWRDGLIEWVGPAADAPRDVERTLEAGGAMVVPGLVDCHTHLAFGGWRADEFAWRIAGRDYLEIARAGGGIASTVRATRAASGAHLVDKARDVLDEMLSLGVTTVECKSGYGLTLHDELRILEAYRSLDRVHPVSLVSTFLGAHVVPPEHRGDPEAYVTSIIEDMLPAVAAGSLASFCDVFVEDTAFSVLQARRIFAAASALGMGAKLHADQMTNTQGAALAAEVGAVSADHLERADRDGLIAMVEAGVTAVTLPLASLYTFQAPWDARCAREVGLEVAVASDFNPGSAPSSHLPLAMMLSCTMNRLTPAAALQGATRVAARAVGRQGSIGQLKVGFEADLAVVDAPSVEHWLYQFRGSRALATVKAGEVVWGDLSSSD